MKRRHEKKLRDRTFPLLDKIQRKRTMSPSQRKRVLWLLGAWSSLNDVPYTYSYADRDLYERMDYCSDRLNSGRARALILLIKNKPFPVEVPINA